MNIPISKKQFKNIVFEYIAENYATYEFETLIISLLVEYSLWEDKDLLTVKKHLDKLIKKQENE